MDSEQTTTQSNTATLQQQQQQAAQNNDNSSFTQNCFLLRFNESQHLPWNNPENIVSQEVEAMSAMIKDMVNAICFLIGGPLNVINMAVFFKQGVRDRVNLCLFMLAVTDDACLLSSFCLHAENVYLYVTGRPIRTPVNEFMANNNLVFLQGTGFVSFFLSAIIACERCYCVLRPLKYQTLMRTRTMAAIIVTVYVSMLSLFYIVVYRYWLNCVYDPVTGESMITVTGGYVYFNNKLFIDLLDGVVFGAIFPGGAMIVVATTTVITIMKLCQIVTWRSETTSSLSAGEVALTKMLVGNSVFFVICIFPAFSFRMLYFVLPEMSAGGLYHNFYLTTLWTLEALSFVNYSCNFFIYFAMGSRYRETFWTLMPCKLRKDKGKG